MRPGRLDQLIFIPMPDYESRLGILKVTTETLVSPALPEVACTLVLSAALRSIPLVHLWLSDLDVSSP